MQLRDPGTAPGPDGGVRLLSIGSRQQLPARVRSLLEGVLALAGSLLETALSRSLNELEQQLFKLAEQARSGNDQQAVFESLREIRRGRADVAPRFLLFLESSLAQLDSRPQAATPRFTELSLVETRELEESITLQEISAKADIRHSQVLYALGHRFGVLAGAPALEVDNLPLGPQQLCAALRYATADLGVALEHRLLLYRQFDRVAVAEVGVLYNAVNDYLAEKRILPNLQLAARGTPAPPAAQRSEPRAAAGASNTASGSSPANGSSEARPTAGARAAGDEMRDSELFHTLRELLAGRRQAVGSEAPGAGLQSDYVASGEDLQSVLGNLQHKPVAPMMLGGRLVQRSIGHLRQDLLNQLRQFTPDGRPPQLSDVDADTLDLVGMLFDFIAKDISPTGATQSLLTRLQVPVLRVALRDKSFFTRRSHPARQLLNAIAETGQYWIDESDGEGDRTLVEKMQMVVDRVGNEFDGRDELFDELLTDLSRHMGTLARKAEVAERRHVDAAKGRERLDLAREQAGRAVAAQLQDRKVGRLVRSLLEQAWTDVLALTLLRQGEDSDAFRQRLRVVEQLAQGPAEADKPALRAEIEQGLAQVGFHADEAQGMLQQLLGDAEAITDDSDTRTALALKLKAKARLGEDAPAAPRAAPPAQTAAPPSPAATRLSAPSPAAMSPAAPEAAVASPAAATMTAEPEAAVASPAAATMTAEAAGFSVSPAPRIAANAGIATNAETAASAEAPAPLSAEERQTLERLKTLPYGTWFEFILNQQGDSVRRKLSWYSTLTGRCLFVNQRGTRTDERSLQQLARDIVRRQASIIVAERETLIDRAWNTIVGTLKTFAGKPQPVPAAGAASR